MSSNYCVACGAEIPEGDQICRGCKIKYGLVETQEQTMLNDLEQNKKAVKSDKLYLSQEADK